MAWIPFTSANLKVRLSGAEYTAVTNAALASGQTAETVVAEVITDVVKLIRGRVKACAHNDLGAGETIPDELKDAAGALLVFRVLTRLPNLKALLDENRVRANTSAEALLKDVAACQLTIEQPATVSAQVTAGATIETVTSTTRTATRAKMAGL